MKKLYLVFILILCLHSWTKADDIKDFQIEGISIGDSALDFFSKSEIKNARKYKLKNDEYTVKEFLKLDFFEKYDNVQIGFKKNDNNFEIFAIEGLIFYENNIEECNNKVDVVRIELSSIFDNTKKHPIKKFKHPYDKSGKSKVTETAFELDDGSVALIACYDWSKKFDFIDNFRISLRSNDYNTWLSTKAY